MVFRTSRPDLFAAAKATGKASAKAGGVMLVGLLVAFSLIGAKPAKADNLAQMLYDVYDNNPDIHAEQAAQDIRRAQTRKATAALMPQVSAVASHSLVEEKLKLSGVDRIRTSQYGIKASQRIFSGFQNKNNLIKAKYEEKSGYYQMRNREREVLLEAVKAYMDVYAARKMITLRRQHVANLEKQLRATQARIRAGELTRTDLSKTKALLFRARASLEGAKADLGGAAGRYEALVGYQPGELIFPQMPVRYMPQTPEEAQKKALQMHPDLRASRAGDKAADYAVKSAEGAFLPTVDVSGEMTKNYASSVSETDLSDRSFSLRLSLPLFDGGARKADLESARAARSQQKHKSNALAANVKANAKEQFLRYQASVASLGQARQEVTAAKDLLRGVRVEEKAGQRSYLDILDAEVSLLDAQELEIYSQADTVIAIYSFLAATGQLTVSGARKEFIRHDPQTAAVVAKARRMASSADVKARKAEPRDASDPWSGLR
ncbi:TolC family outer membrane protein [uncultured Cohaesibacter sp.]|uniref:TolC family outer membrane protein n=1 Tax=uncultured Cohaesibacter sp. TaxID=1002546 RepID=UPI00292E51F0|nr:TolC family outer membrane protein [uncultured Cohaesibacter sp.]